MKPIKVGISHINPLIIIKPNKVGTYVSGVGLRIVEFRFLGLRVSGLGDFALAI